MDAKPDFEKLFRDSPYPSMVMATNLTIMNTNAAFLLSTGRIEDELLGYYFFDVFPENPHDPESTNVQEIKASMESAIDTGKPHTVSLIRYALPRQSKGRTTFENRYWSIVHTPILAGSGSVEYLFQTAIDVTPFNNSTKAGPDSSAPKSPYTHDAENFRAQMYEAMARILNDEQGHLRNLFNQAPGFVALMIGPRRVLTMVNEAYYQLFGQRTSVGKSVWDALPELAGQGYEEIFEQVYRTGKPWVGHGLSMTILQASGPLVERFVDLTCQPYHGIDGGILGIFAQGYDVTEAHVAHIAQAAHRGREERLQEGIRAAKMMVWDWEAESRKLIVSDNCREVIGRTADSIESILESFHPKDTLKLNAAHQRAIRECSEYREIIPFTRPDNGKKLWLDIHGKAICDTSGNLYAMRGVMLDITERMEAEEYLHKANRLKDEFLAMLAHELRNPLAPITLAAQLIKSGKLNEIKLRDASDIITRQVMHMTGLIEDLMDVSRVTRGVIATDCQPIDIKIIISDAIEQIRPLIETREHHFHLELCPEAALVLGDRERLVQVLSNILNNAAKYTIAGGNIVLRLKVNIEQVLITITDNGVGINADLLPHVFELFTQAERTSDRSQGGLGVGLSLAKSLVELHRGTILVASDGADKGSKFTICLPRLYLQDPHAANPGRQKEALHDTPHTPHTPLKIILVDDNKDAALTLATILEFEGHQVIVEHNARGALERVKSYEPDVFLLDIGLPEIDGNELARILRSLPQTAQAIFIAITGYGQEMDKAKTKQAGFNYHLVKPVDITKLKALLPRNSGTIT